MSKAIFTLKYKNRTDFYVVKTIYFYFSDSSFNSEKFICKESFWWDGIEIIPPRPKMGLLSAFANRGGGGDTESIVSDESTTEEFTEEETISSASIGSDEGSAESNPPPKKVY